MSGGEFSDDLSDPTPSPSPPAPRGPSSSSTSTTAQASNNVRIGSGSGAVKLPVAHRRTVSAASAGRSSVTMGGKSNSAASGQPPTGSLHSRNTSLANSLVMSQVSGKGTLVNGRAMSDNDRDDDEDEDEEDEDDNEEGSQSGSELSDPPSEGEDTQMTKPKRVANTKKADERQHDQADDNDGQEGGEEDEDEEDNEEAPDDEDEDEEDENSFAHPVTTPVRAIHARTASGNIPTRATRQSSLRSAGGGRTGRGVIPAGMWEWAKKKTNKKPKKSDDEDDDEEGSDAEENEEDEEGENQEGDESAVKPANADEDEPMLNGTTHEPTPEDPDEAEGQSDANDGTQMGAQATNKSKHSSLHHSSNIPTVKVEPPPSATISSFRKRDLEIPSNNNKREALSGDVSPDGGSPALSPAPTPTPTTGTGGRSNNRSRATNGRAGNKRSHRPPPKRKESQREREQREQREQRERLEQQQRLQQQLMDDADEMETQEINSQLQLVDREDGEEHLGDPDEEEGEEGEGEDFEGVEGTDGAFGSRQEALDALSLLELKFALIRQRIYSDKMEELGKEEKLVADGSHPELLHTYIELDKRRERRATLAEFKRKREVDLAAVTRVNDEDVVWSWWMIQKDVLQSNLITDASRKRRRVERERRALLDPLRRTLDLVPPPPPPPEALLRSSRRSGGGGAGEEDDEEMLLPARPSTKSILAVALRHPYARLRPFQPLPKPKAEGSAAAAAAAAAGAGAVGATGSGVEKASAPKPPAESMPTLSQLNAAEINSDLEVLTGYRRGFVDPGVVLNAGTVVTELAGATFNASIGGVGGSSGGPAASGPYGGASSGTGMDTPMGGMSGTITVGNAVVPTAPEAFNPALGGDLSQPGGGGGGGGGGMLEYPPRNMYELEQQRERDRARNRDSAQAQGQGHAFNDHLAAHQYSNAGMPPGKAPSNGRERDRDRDRERAGSKKYASAAAPSMGHGGYVSGTATSQQQQHQQQQHQQRERESHGHGGYPHSHRQGMDTYASPGLGLQNMQRLPDTAGPRDRERDGMVGIQHLPLPPAPSTIPAGSSSSKHHHHHHPAPPPPSGHPQASQHPSLVWEGSRRGREREHEREREREREADIPRERSHSSAGRNSGISSSYAAAQGPPTGNSQQASTGRPHSHSMSHPHSHAHYHPTAHAHSRSSAQSGGGNGHGHSHVHTHQHTHPHAAGSTSHLHVIHNHGPAPTGNSGGGNAPPPTSSSGSVRRYEDVGAPAPSNGGGHRARTSYPSGPTVDREKELRERERLAGAVPSVNVMHPSLSHGGGGGGQERDRHPGYSIPPWNERDRERERMKERDDRREERRDDRRDRERGNMMSMSSLSSHPQQQQQSQQQQGGGGSTRGSRSGSLTMHPSQQGNSYSQAQAPAPGSRYAYPTPSAYSPPATQASQSRRNSPPPLLPPVPNTSRYTTSSTNSHRRTSPAPVDSLSYTSTSQAPADHSPTSSLNPPGFNPWSAPPRSSGRAYRPSPPPQKISPPTGVTSSTFGSSAGGGPLNTLPGPTLSPILPTAISPAPRPSISPAPRPPSSSSIHAILQAPAPSRESIVSPQPVKRSSGFGEAGSGPMDVDPPVQQQSSAFRHPSLAPLNHDGK